MDRITTYTQALGRSTDFLQSQQNAMIGLAWEAQALLGTQTAVDGFTCIPTAPASLTVSLTPGAIYQLANLEATNWSSLPANTGTSIVKQGLMQSVDPITLAPPTTSGYSQSFLIEAQYADLDTTPTLLPYYNSSNSAQPYQGPNNSGVSQNTARLGIAAIQVKVGIAATSGTQIIPAPDAGWVGLFVVTLSNGQTTITSGNIAIYAGTGLNGAGTAPFIPVKLTGVPAGVLSGAWTFGTASGTNAYTTSLFSTAAYPFAFTAGMEILVYFANANTTTTPTLNANGTGAKSIVKQGGGAVSAGDLSGFMALVYDGTYWRINGLVASDILAIISANKIGLENPLPANTVPGTYIYTPTPGARGAIIVGQAPGGGASASSTTTSAQMSVGVPGSAGGYFEHFVLLPAGYSASYTVGAPGPGGAGGGSAGSNGTPTSFAGGPTAIGGQGGPATVPVATPAYSNTAAVSGSAATGGNLKNRPGGASQASQYLGSTAYAGLGGASQNGSSGIAYATTSPGTVGAGYGSGGTPGVTQPNANAQSGGNGAPGFIQITEIF